MAARPWPEPDRASSCAGEDCTGPWNHMTSEPASPTEFSIRPLRGMLEISVSRMSESADWVSCLQPPLSQPVHSLASLAPVLPSPSPSPTPAPTPDEYELAAPNPARHASPIGSSASPGGAAPGLESWGS